MATRLVVEWTRATLRVAVAGGRRGTLRLRALHTQPLGAVEDIPGAVRRALTTTRTAGAFVIGVIPREQVITRMVTFPTTDAGELAQMVSLYAAAQLPYPREQTAMGFHVLRAQEGSSTVAIIACQREIVERHVALLREAGLSPALVTLSSWGVLAWHRRLGADRAPKAPEEREPVLVIHVDDTRTDLVLIQGGCLLASRSIGQGAQEWTEPDEAAELLALEIERSQAAVRKELAGLEARSVLLTGLGDMKVWSERLSQRIGMPVVVVDARQPLEGWTGQTSQPISPVVVGGLALSEPGGLLDLSPPEVRLHLRHREQVRELATVGALLLAVLALGAFVLGLQTVRGERQARQLDEALAQIEPVAARVREKTRAVQMVEDVLASRRRLAEHLSGVLRITPPDVTLETLTFERPRRELVVRGVAASTQTVLAYVSQLERLPGIGLVQLRYARRRAGPAGERTEFELLLRQGQTS